MLCSILSLAVACGGMEESTEETLSLNTVRQRLALFDYQASSSTNNATDPNTSADYWISLNAGEAVMIGTCVLNESLYSGDTYLRLFNPSAVEVASNDDYCLGLGSKISYTPSVTGTFMIRAGCWSSTTCSGTVSIARRKGTPVAFNVSNTNNAGVNTYNKQYSFNGGDVVRVSTCSYNSTGASATGDTYLRLYQNNAGVYTQVAANDTAATGSCGTAAEIVYTIPTAGYYQFRVGCAANTACNGNVAVYVE
jgi:hypothetical protein